jgi:RsiW-degrading membrane proteinase PrsW (M82 family)
MSYDTTASSAHPHSHPQPAQPHAAPPELQAQTHAPPQPVFADPVLPSSSRLAWGVAGIVVGALALLGVLAYMLFALGPVLLVASSVLAVVPLAIVLYGVLWIDRWEPEPRGLLLFAFLWGSGVSVAVALIVGFGIDAVVDGAVIDAGTYEFLGAVVQAPVVEEVAKGVGVLLIFLVARRYFDGPVDGVVYASVTAAGFAFTENILYFAASMAESGLVSADATMTFFLRGIMSPFAHAMFTAMIGLFIGLWGRRSTMGGMAGFLVGLGLAIMLHALWNATSYLGLLGWFAVYVIVQMPLFAGTIVLVVQLRRREALLTQERLAEYAAAGWISPQEVATLGTASGRRHARLWAKANGIGTHMERYIRDATRLAFARQRIVSGRDRIGAQKDELVLLAQVTASRQALMAAPRLG